MNIFKIRESKNNVKDSIELLQIFSESKNLFFHLIEIDGIADNNNYLEIENEVNDSGKIFNEYDLLDFLSGLRQIFGLVILINFDKKKIKKPLINSELLFDQYFATISYFDAGFWEVTCRDEKIKQSLLKNFNTYN